jgi:hypothetical protein
VHFGDPLTDKQRMNSTWPQTGSSWKSFFLPKEVVLLEFKRVNGSGWLTNYRAYPCTDMNQAI